MEKVYFIEARYSEADVWEIDPLKRFFYSAEDAKEVMDGICYPSGDDRNIFNDAVETRISTLYLYKG